MTSALTGKVAVVTGASKGIGAEIARQLAQAGAAVVVNYASSQAGAQRVVGEIEAQGGKALAVQANIAAEADVVRLFETTLDTFGRVDVLVNNAGVYEFAPLTEVSAEHFHRQFDLNVLGLLWATREFAKRVGPDGGSVVNVSSAVVTVTPPNSAVYSATKAAVDAVTMSLAKELGPRKIRVNSVNPGMIETEGVLSAGLHESELRQWIETSSPAGRIGRVQDVAPVVAFLASDQAGYITGETLHIAGGLR